MPVLDRFLTVMFEKQARAVLMETDNQVFIDVGHTRHPVTKESLPSDKILTLIREIMPVGMHPQLVGDDGRTTFGYVINGNRVDIEFVRKGALLTAELTPAKSATKRKPKTKKKEAPPEPADEESPQPIEITVSDSQAEANLRSLLEQLAQTRSSDLHFHAGSQAFYRKHGELKPLAGSHPLTDSDIEQMVLATIPPERRAEYEQFSSVDYGYEITGVARFRIHALRDLNGVSAIIRVVPHEIQTVDELGLTPQVQKLCYLKDGLILVTGPRGSGKSTTLGAMVDLINRSRTDHILTVEDPIEFVHVNKSCVVTQREVPTHSPSFFSAVRAALREDADVVFISDMQEPAVAEAAIDLAARGHLVLGAMHTTTVVNTVDRLIASVPPDRQAQSRMVLSEVLRGIVCQVLLRKIGGGLVPAREILITTDAVSKLILEGKTFQLPSTLRTQRKTGMQGLNEALIELVEQRAIEPEEAYRRSMHKASMETALEQRGIRISP